MTTRKMIAIPLTRKKYQEKVSNPPPAGRGPYPVEIRISVSAPSFFTSGLLAQTDSREVEDGCDECQRDDTDRREAEEGNAFIVDFRPEAQERDVHDMDKQE